VIVLAILSQLHELRVVLGIEGHLAVAEVDCHLVHDVVIIQLPEAFICSLDGGLIILNFRLRLGYFLLLSSSAAFCCANSSWLCWICSFAGCMPACIVCASSRSLPLNFTELAMSSF
jgi:hypothetical protein